MSDTNLSAIDVLKLTDRSNCGKCGAPNCMAFAALAIAGQKDPDACPVLDDEIKARIRQKAEGRAERAESDDGPGAMIERIKGSLADMDFDEAAARLGGSVKDGRLVIHCLGRIFELDRDGRMYSLCHVNDWVHVALLLYVVLGKGEDPKGEWLGFRELKEARDWERFFEHRCLAAMRRLADGHPELFLDIVELFGEEYKADGPMAEHSIVLRPLPKVPFLICYTPKDGPFESTLSMFFDRSIESNLRAEGTYMLGVGITEMFGRIIEKHDLGEDPLARVHGV